MLHDAIEPFEVPKTPAECDARGDPSAPGMRWRQFGLCLGFGACVTWVSGLAVASLHFAVREEWIARWLCVVAEHPSRSTFAIALLALALLGRRAEAPREVADGSRL